MKKYVKWILVLFIIFLITGIIVFYFSSNKNSNQPSDATKISTNILNTQVQNETSNDSSNTEKEIRSATQGLEKEISNFSTKIMDEDNNRDNNMEISLSKINGTIVKKGHSFSFNDIVGSPTPNEGYKKAGVFVENKLKKDYGRR